MIEAPVKDIMTAGVATIKSHSPLIDACNLMYERRHSCLVVTDKGCPIGIITERDMVRILIDYLETKPDRSADLNCYMSAKPLTISETMLIKDAMELMQDKKIRHLPVTDAEGKLAGLVTYSDLVRNKQSLIDKQDDIIAESVAKQTENLEKSNQDLRLLTLEDPLLKIGNRRAMEHDLHYAHETSMRYDTVYSVVLLDVDYFKKYNDHYGHKKGDEVLQFVASFLKSCVRGADRVYRYGGEEFLMLLPETGVEGTELLIKRVITDLAKLNVVHEKSPFGHITISCGIASEEPGKFRDSSWEHLVCRADEALYFAKEQGRNQHAVSYSDNDIHTDKLEIAV